MAITGLKASKWTLGAMLAIAGLFVSDNASVMQGTSLITQANARIGRPLTPLSVAGVARRNTRRAYYYGGAAAAGAAALAPSLFSWSTTRPIRSIPELRMASIVITTYWYCTS